MINPQLLELYYIIAFVFMLYAFYKVGITKISFLIIMIFWEGLFAYLGDVVQFKYQINIGFLYNIIIALYIISLTIPMIFKKNSMKRIKLDLAFLLFTLIFWISFYLNKGGVITITNQYIMKYLLLYLLYKYYSPIFTDWSQIRYMRDVIILVLNIQIALSIIKILIFGFGVEPIVGSMSSGGAGAAVVIPIVSLIFYWIITNGILNKKDWIIITLLLALSIASGKRQTILLFPLILILLSINYYGRNSLKMFLKIIPIAILLFYISIRVTPGITPEGKVWGSFDIKHVTSYTLKYYTGSTTIKDLNTYGTTYHRVGGLKSFINPKMLNMYTKQDMLFGKGLYNVVSGEYGNFVKTYESGSDFGIDNIGLVGGSVRYLYSLGYMGIFSLILFGLIIISETKNRRLRLILVSYFLWDFIFYYSQTLFSVQSAVIVLFIIYYSNKDYITIGNK